MLPAAVVRAMQGPQRRPLPKECVIAQLGGFIGSTISRSGGSPACPAGKHLVPREGNTMRLEVVGAELGHHDRSGWRNSKILVYLGVRGAPVDLPSSCTGEPRCAGRGRQGAGSSRQGRAHPGAEPLWREVTVSPGHLPSPRGIPRGGLAAKGPDRRRERQLTRLQTGTSLSETSSSQEKCS